MRKRLTDEELQAIRAERQQAGQAIETLKAAFAVPGVTPSHPQLAPFMAVLKDNPQVRKLVWFSAIRFQGYDGLLAARYPGADSVALAMRDAARKGGYAPADRLDWRDFRSAISKGLTHDEWEALLKQLPELPKRERKANPALAQANSLTEFFAAQQQPREDDDEDEEEALTPPQELRLTLMGAEPAKAPVATPTSLPTLDISSLMASAAGSHAPVAPLMVQPGAASAMPDLTKVIGDNGAADSKAKAELRFKLELAKVSGKDVDLLLQFVDTNPDGVRMLARQKGIEV